MKGKNLNVNEAERIRRCEFIVNKHEEEVRFRIQDR